MMEAVLSSLPAALATTQSDAVVLDTSQHYVELIPISLGLPYQGVVWIERGLRAYRATGSTLGVPFGLALKGEALHLADRTSEALEAINEADALAQRFEQRFWCAELHRLRAVFLAAIGAEEPQIEGSFRTVISTAKEQKSVSLQKRAEATYAEYRRQKASALGGRGFRLPLW